MDNKDDMLIDRVDDNDNVIGPIKRGNIYREQANFRTVHVFVFNSRGELLLQKLSADREEYPGHWGSSAAGYVSSGESYQEAAARKLSEELNLANPNIKLIGKTTMEIGGNKKFVALFKTEHNGPFTPKADEVEEVKFSPLEEVKKQVQENSMDFTPTFLHLFNFYQSQLN